MFGSVGVLTRPAGCSETRQRPCSVLGHPQLSQRSSTQRTFAWRALPQVVTKNHSFTSVVTEQWVRLLHHCGMPVGDVDIVHSQGAVMGELLRSPHVRMTQFTGSSTVAEHLAVQLRGACSLRQERERERERERSMTASRQWWCTKTRLCRVSENPAGRVSTPADPSIIRRGARVNNPH
jgi:hypothetical protein